MMMMWRQLEAVSTCKVDHSFLKQLGVFLKGNC
ncbi:hypothetical protein LINPERPRIM_LOCUS6193, partial [Linum perenne]